MSDETEDRKLDLTRVVEEVIDKGATSAEEIHRAVGELPIAVLENLGLDEAATGTRQIQDRSISAIYGLIRTINHQVASLATELLEQRDHLAAKDKE